MDIRLTSRDPVDLEEKESYLYDVWFGFDEMTHGDEATVALNAIGNVRKKIFLETNTDDESWVSIVNSERATSIRALVRRAQNTTSDPNRVQVFMPNVETYSVVAPLGWGELKDLHAALVAYPEAIASTVKDFTHPAEAHSLFVEAQTAQHMARTILTELQLPEEPKVHGPARKVGF